ncbi:MAG: DUF5658 family protein [Neomegalonema sp.]|nr:DUF5658 family protein [Neomegalonema sp.]
MSASVAKKTITMKAAEARALPMRESWGFWLAVFLVMVGFLDVVSTEVALGTGAAREANPVVRSMMESIGVYWIAPKMLLHVMLGYMVVWYPNLPTLLTMSGVSMLVLAAAVSNSLIYLHATGAL